MGVFGYSRRSCFSALGDDHDIPLQSRRVYIYKCIHENQYHSTSIVCLLEDCCSNELCSSCSGMCIQLTYIMQEVSEFKCSRGGFGRKQTDFRATTATRGSEQWFAWLCRSGYRYQ